MSPSQHISSRGWRSGGSRRSRRAARARSASRSRGSARSAATPGRPTARWRRSARARGRARRAGASRPSRWSEHVLERALRERVVQALARDPRAVLLRPGLLALAEDAAVAQQLLGDAVARRGPGAAQVVAAAQQVAQSPSVSASAARRTQLARRGTARTSFLASRRSVLTRSPARTGTSDGAITSHATPRRRQQPPQRQSRRARPHSRPPGRPGRRGGR